MIGCEDHAAPVMSKHLLFDNGQSWVTETTRPRLRLSGNCGVGGEASSRYVGMVGISQHRPLPLTSLPRRRWMPR